MHGARFAASAAKTLIWVPGLQKNFVCLHKHHRKMRSMVTRARKIN
jgi:hypothetical protein